MGQDLIYATTKHDVTAQQHRHHVRITDHAESPAAHSHRWRHARHGAKHKDLPEGGILVLGRQVNQALEPRSPFPHSGQITGFPRHHQPSHQRSRQPGAEGPLSAAESHGEATARNRPVRSWAVTAVPTMPRVQTSVLKGKPLCDTSYRRSSDVAVCCSNIRRVTSLSSFDIEAEASVKGRSSTGSRRTVISLTSTVMSPTTRDPPTGRSEFFDRLLRPLGHRLDRVLLRSEGPHPPMGLWGSS